MPVLAYLDKASMTPSIFVQYSYSTKTTTLKQECKYWYTFWPFEAISKMFFTFNLDYNILFLNFQYNFRISVCS